MSAPADAALVAAHTEVKAELARTDTKASLLLAFHAALLAGALALATGAPLTLASALVGAAGLGVLLAATALLLLTVRPNLGGGGGFPLWATLTPAGLRTHLSADRLPKDITNLSRIAVGKFARLRAAISMTLLAGALLVAAAVLTLGGAL
ncbi:Pycsar system effector family protein [Streptomyces sp. NPDC048172]|uniref:Pycsar system effector family protein n=1 Tax=Streptomyces sp. NPDC048172 TaxID=3365505 RepID=UPI00371D7639